MKSYGKFARNYTCAMGYVSLLCYWLIFDVEVTILGFSFFSFLVSYGEYRLEVLSHWQGEGSWEACQGGVVECG